MVKNKKTEPTELMVVNDTPGDECRIAILRDGRLEELYSERLTSATNVGNIYKGRVATVEPAIQAAFVDYGQGQNGFLHISDLHPRYFPGAERTERVGKKIPRRDRPPIQEALRRGDEVLIQVLKQGIGTKGPTLTSYLSIPGRLLVMMPDMDRVGVSRKVEDEEKRREMRKVLDSLDLPEGFGFILRTAGFGRTKTELKRDAAYLTRLWRVMDKRIKSSKAPCELYTESDLLVRTIRDVLRPSIDSIVVDSQSAHDRATRFLQVVAPRSAPKVIHYRRATPIFHAFDVERQIEMIHSREVPLPSGGAIVIEQTEALVAIDVNSGKSRAARDSETNAYRTNCEAADEICRQLRLRDLGGLIVNDLIDMRNPRNRRQVEDRFRQNLSTDRAKSTVLRISDLGMLEMTRQRMRPSMRKSHYTQCTHCLGAGEVKAAESVGADAIRHVGNLLQHDRVKRVEMVCSPRVASVLLSGKRRELVHMEDGSRKRIDVRVSDAIAVDRVDYYAYDDRNADIDIERLPTAVIPSLEQIEREDVQREEPEVRPEDHRRRRRGGPADATAIALAGGFDLDDDEEDELDEAEETAAETAERHKKPRRRRRRRSRRREDEAAQTPVAEAATATSQTSTTSDAAANESIRVYTLAKELGVKSKEVLEQCEQDASVDLPLKNHMSVIPAEAVDTVRSLFTDEGAPSTTSTTSEAAAAAPRRRRRGGRRRRAQRERQAQAEAAALASPPLAPDPEPSKANQQETPEPPEAQAAPATDDPVKKRSRRRGRGGRKASPNADAGATTQPASEAAPTTPPAKRASPTVEGAGARKKKGRRRAPARSAKAGSNGQSASPPASPAPDVTITVKQAAGSESGRKSVKKSLYRNRSRVSSAARAEAER